MKRCVSVQGLSGEGAGMMWVKALWPQLLGRNCHYFQQLIHWIVPCFFLTHCDRMHVLLLPAEVFNPECCIVVCGNDMCQPTRGFFPSGSQ